MARAHSSFARMTNTEEQIFRNRLRSYTILDIGILESVSKTADGIYGSLRSNKPSPDGSATRYTNVELLNFGSSKGGFSVGGDGEDLYLLFCPMSSMPSVLTREATGDDEGVYSTKSMKGIPISSAINWASRAGFDRSGNFNISFPDSSLTFNVDSSIRYQHGTILKAGKNADGSAFVSLLAGTYQLFVMSDGSWYTCVWGSGGYLQDLKIRKSDGTVIERRWSTSAPSDTDKQDLPNFTDFLYEEISSTSGARSITYRNSSGAAIASETIDTSGKRTLTSEGVDIEAGAGKIKIASTAFNYSSWLNDFVSTITTMVIDPSTYLPNATAQVSLQALITELVANTE